MKGRDLRKLCLWVLAVIWAVHLALPLHLFQEVRWNLGNYPIPFYYFFTALLVLAMAVYALSFKRGWRKWEICLCT